MILEITIPTTVSGAIHGCIGNETSTCGINQELDRRTKPRTPETAPEPQPLESIRV